MPCFLKFIISVRGGHCYYSPRAPENLATSCHFISILYTIASFPSTLQLFLSLHKSLLFSPCGSVQSSITVLTNLWSTNNYVKVCFLYPMLPHIQDSNVLFERSQSSPACPSDKSSITIKLSMSIGGMMLTRENQSTGTETCPSATLSTANPTHTPAGGRNLACEVRGGRLTASAIVQPFISRKNEKSKSTCLCTATRFPKTQCFVDD